MSDQGNEEDDKQVMRVPEDLKIRSPEIISSK